MCLDKMYSNSHEYRVLRSFLYQIKLVEYSFNDPKRIIPIDKITCNRDYDNSNKFLFDTFTYLIEFAGALSSLAEQNKNNNSWRYRSSINRAGRLYMKTYSKVRNYFMK